MAAVVELSSAVAPLRLVVDHSEAVVEVLLNLDYHYSAVGHSVDTVGYLVAVVTAVG